MISFLYPWALLGLVAAAVPIVLHLIARRRPPTVVFPAIQYLVDTTRQHQRRLKLRNLLLLVLRTALIVALVLAAAAPSVPMTGAPGHAPGALVLVLDNSASSGAVVDGVPIIDGLREAALAVLANATPDDALWLLLADGVARRGGRDALQATVADIRPSDQRLDLGAAVVVADDILAVDQRPGEIIVLSDMQASAITEAVPEAALVVARSPQALPGNAGIAALDPGVQPWLPDGGRVTLALAGDSGRTVSAAIAPGDRPQRQVLVTVGSPAEIRIANLSAGWWPLTATLDPDELRVDDTHVSAVRVAPPARLFWNPLDRHVSAACEVLASAGRVTKGDRIALGILGTGTSIVLPPADPAQLGALNRALGRRGIAWRFGDVVTVEQATDSTGMLGSVVVRRRHRLEPTTSGRTGLLLTVNGEPWMVQSRDVVLVGSRFDPEWTDLPLTAGFVPFLDLLVNQIAQGGLARLSAAPGDVVQLPDRVTEIRLDDRSWRVEGGASFRAPAVGAYYLLAEADTVGALAVNVDPRESNLERASDQQVRALWHSARLVTLGEVGSVAFTAGARSDLRGLLLWLALLLGLAEVAVASTGRRVR
ncbi:MAG: BatA and WFA domain-containing protein [Gemmatimonadota bacterium]|nr:BatA and WFA domain-containing protein [Gemmatimonadota bacterium]